MEQPFVIHIHSGYGQLHYDLMLSRGQALATWQLPHSPVDLEAGQSMPARRLPDHRPAYLTYEGPISGGRGQVALLDRGSYQLLAEQPERWQIALQGQELTGRYELFRCGPDADAWTLRRLGDD